MLSRGRMPCRVSQQEAACHSPRNLLSGLEVNCMPTSPTLVTEVAGPPHRGPEHAARNSAWQPGLLWAAMGRQPRPIKVQYESRPRRAAL